MAIKSEKYWKSRSEQRLTKVLRDAEKTLKLLESQYKNASISINNDIQKLYSQFAGENNISMDKAMELIHGSEFVQWRMSMDEYLKRIDMTGDKKLLLELNTLAMRSRITRLEALNAEIMANVAFMTQGADENTSLLLIRSLENTYYESMYDEYKDRNPKVFDLMEKHNVGLSKAQIDRELKIPWSGANYSTNLWNNADYIANKCQQLVAQNIIAGTSIDRLTSEVTRLFGSNYRASARRLILTETAYIKGQADKLTYERLGIEEYELLATLDSRTSKICQDKDGKHYPLDEAVVGKNYPPFHPHCRTTTVKYDPDNEERTRIARDKDGKNVTVPYDMKYKEWKEWVKSGQSLDDWLEDNSDFNISTRIENDDNKGINKDKDIKVEHSQISKLKGSMKENEYFDFKDNLDRAPNSIKKLYANYGDSINKIVKSKRESYYRDADKFLTYQIHREEYGLNKFSTLAHEYGHAFDYNSKYNNLNHKESDGIKNAVNTSFINLLFANSCSNSDEFLKAYRKDKEDLRDNYREVAKTIVKNHHSHGLQDTLDGMFLARDSGLVRWGHGSKYYNRTYKILKDTKTHNKVKKFYKDNDYNVNRLMDVADLIRDYEGASELFANISSALFTQDESLEFIKKYLPNSYEAYLKILEVISEI